MITVGFERTVIVIQERLETVEVCVYITSGILGRNLEVLLENKGGKNEVRVLENE